jgi:GNAT superfamily N-acetyltransferase
MVESNDAFDKEYELIETALKTEPYIVRHYVNGSGPVANGILDTFMNDETGETLSANFCGVIEGPTISIHAVEANAVSLLYDQDSYYGEDEDDFSFAAFALLNSRSPYEKKGEKVLYVDIICTSQRSRRAKKRYGEALLKSIESLAKERGYQFVELDSLSSAKGFYEKMGYTAVGEGSDGTVMRKSLELTGGSRLRLKTLRKSHKKEKKWDAVFETADGKEKVVPFGQKGYSDFTKHKDTKRRQRYIDRHSGMGEDWKDPTTPGALSRYILWNKKTLRASLKDFKKKFRV